MADKDLAQIIRDNPGCVAIVDNDAWALYASDPYENEDAEELACESDVVPVGEGYGSGSNYGGDLLQALAIIVGIKVMSV